MSAFRSSLNRWTKPQEEIADLFNLRSKSDWIVDAGLMEPDVYIKTMT